MKLLRFVDLADLGWDEQRARILASRPLAADSRVQWWSALVGELRDELAASIASARNDHVRLGEVSNRIVELASEVGDISAIDAAIMAASLARAMWDSDLVSDQELSIFGPEDVARRCIATIPIDAANVRELIGRERTFLLEDERAWAMPDRPESERDVSAAGEFSPLDDLRRILGVLKIAEPKIRDAALLAEVHEWLTFEGPLQHDEEVARRGLELLAYRAKEDDSAEKS